MTLIQTLVESILEKIIVSHDIHRITWLIQYEITSNYGTIRRQGPGSAFVDGTKPSPEPTLTHHRWYAAHMRAISQEIWKIYPVYDLEISNLRARVNEFTQLKTIQKAKNSNPENYLPAIVFRGWHWAVLCCNINIAFLAMIWISLNDWQCCHIRFNILYTLDISSSNGKWYWIQHDKEKCISLVVSLWIKLNAAYRSLTSEQWWLFKKFFTENVFQHTENAPLRMNVYVRVQYVAISVIESNLQSKSCMIALFDMQWLLRSLFATNIGDLVNIYLNLGQWQDSLFVL